MNKYNFIDSFFLCFNLFVSFLSSVCIFVFFCNHFEIIRCTLTYVFVEIRLKIGNLKSVFERQSLGAKTSLPNGLKTSRSFYLKRMLVPYLEGFKPMVRSIILKAVKINVLSIVKAIVLKTSCPRRLEHVL